MVELALKAMSDESATAFPGIPRPSISIATTTAEQQAKADWRNRPTSSLNLAAIHDPSTASESGRCLWPRLDAETCLQVLSCQKPSSRCPLPGGSSSPVGVFAGR